MTSAPAERLHARLGALGPFVGHPPLPAAAADEGWAPLSGLMTSTRWVEQLVEHTRTALALAAGVPASAVEERVAASTAHLGVLARLVSPAVAMTALTSDAPDLGRHLWLRHDQHRLVAALDYEGLVLDQAADPDGGPDLRHSLLRGVLLPLGAQLTSAARLSPGIVRGNTASALRGAVLALRTTSAQVAGLAHHLVAPVLSDPELAQAWEVAPGAPSTWRRRSCCLFYRLPHGGLCGDCALTSVPGARGAR